MQFLETFRRIQKKNLMCYILLATFFFFCQNMLPTKKKAIGKN